jgi:tRNA(fMet)-specific endonuclease VapC
MTPAFLLDTDTVSWALRGQGRVAARLLEHRPSEIGISAITLAELRYGADAKGSRKLHALIDAFVEPITVVPFDEAAANRFGLVAKALDSRGQPIGTFDTLLAAQALASGLVLVTNNMRHFRRVTGLRLENWASEA